MFVRFCIEPTLSPLVRRFVFYPPIVDALWRVGTLEKGIVRLVIPSWLLVTAQTNEQDETKLRKLNSSMVAQPVIHRLTHPLQAAQIALGSIH